MIDLALSADRKGPLRVLCLGAHCDDVEIGCGGTLLKLFAEHRDLEVDWAVFCGDETRLAETRAAATRIGGKPDAIRLHALHLRDGYLPYSGEAAKDALRTSVADFNPDIVFTHWRNDAHQDHRLVSELTGNVFRDHLILEYEIPKYDGDLATPNAYVPLSPELVDRKVNMLLDSFASQTHKHWFSDETFRAILRLRGLETGRTHLYAEAFYCYKFCLAPPPGR